MDECLCLVHSKGPTNAGCFVNNINNNNVITIILAVPCSLRDLSSLTRDGTQA